MTDQNIIHLINQLVEIKQKIVAVNMNEKFERNFNRIFSLLEDTGFIYRYAIGDKYDTTHTDCEAAIMGGVSKNMVITRVIKPAVYKKINDSFTMVQKAVVVVEKV